MRDAHASSGAKQFTYGARTTRPFLLASLPAEAKTHGEKEQQVSGGASFSAAIGGEEVATAGGGKEDSRAEDSSRSKCCANERGEEAGEADAHSGEPPAR